MNPLGMPGSVEVQKGHLLHDRVCTTQVGEFRYTPTIVTGQQTQNAERVAGCEPIFMQVLAVEDVEQAKVNLRANLTEGDVFSWYKLRKSLGTVVTRDEALIKDQFRNGQGDRAFELRADCWVVSDHVDGHHTDVQVTESVWVPANLSLKKVRMVAYLPELHD